MFDDIKRGILEKRSSGLRSFPGSSGCITSRNTCTSCKSLPRLVAVAISILCLRLTLSNMICLRYFEINFPLGETSSLSTGLYSNQKAILSLVTGSEKRFRFQRLMRIGRGKRVETMTEGARLGADFSYIQTRSTNYCQKSDLRRASTVGIYIATSVDQVGGRLSNRQVITCLAVMRVSEETLPTYVRVLYIHTRRELLLLPRRSKPCCMSWPGSETNASGLVTPYAALGDR